MLSFISFLSSLLVIDFLFSLRILSSRKRWRQFKINKSVCRVLKKSSNELGTEKVMKFELLSRMQIGPISCRSVENNINVTVHNWSSNINCLLFLTHLFTYSMEQSPSWEADRFSASKEIPSILWNPKVYCRIYKSPPPVHILNQIDLAHASHLTPWRSILILSSHLRLGLPNGLFPSGYQNRVYNSPLHRTSYMPRPSFFCLDNLLLFLNKVSIRCAAMFKLISVGTAEVIATMLMKFSSCCDMLLRPGVLNLQNTFVQWRI